MALVVPILRLYLLFLNVFETFKNLKPARRSLRTGEQTPRAISQRKRDMKGCMAIWLFWCSCAMIETVTDTTVGLVMPFYNEIKAILYLFQIITRARGAEPIYLHVMRPLVKPYVATLDYALEVVTTIGDFITLLVSIPIGFILNWWRPSASVSEEPGPASEGPSEEQEGRREREQKPVRQPSNGSVVGTRTRGVRQASDPAIARKTVVAPSRISRPNGPLQSRSDVAVGQKHKIWRPPASTQDGDEYDERPGVNRRVVSDSAASTVAASSDSSTPPLGTPSEIGEIDVVMEEVEEWRQYPPFPSAYPTTPQVRPMPIKVAPSTQHQSTLNGIYELPQPQYDSSTVPQGRDRQVKPKAPVVQSLPSRTGRRKLHSEGEIVKVQDFGLSPERLRNMKGEGETKAMDLGNVGEDRVDDDDEYDEDEDEDDTLNLTLRTPPHQRTSFDTTSRPHLLPREVSPPPELRTFHLTSEAENDDYEDDPLPNATGPSGLFVPSGRSRVNSNYTLSSTRATRTDSGASLTTISRGSSNRTTSRAPSLASKASGGSASDVPLDAEPSNGVKQPEGLQDKPGQTKITGRPAMRRPGRSSGDPPSKPGVPKVTINARSLNPRPTGAGRPVKPVTFNSRSVPKISRKPAGSGKPDGNDPLDNVDEMGVLGSGTATVKSRKVKTIVPPMRVERTSSLKGIPEETRQRDIAQGPSA